MYRHAYTPTHIHIPVIYKYAYTHTHIQILYVCSLRHTNGSLHFSTHALDFDVKVQFLM